MVFEGMGFLVLWAVLGIASMPVLAVVGWKKQGRFGVVTNVGYGAVEFGVLGFLPIWAALIALAPALISYLLVRARFAALRNVRADLHLVEDPPPKREDVATIAGELVATGFEELATLATDGTGVQVWQCAFARAEIRTLAVVVWMPEIKVPKPSVQLISRLEGGGGVVTVERLLLSPPPGVFAQSFPDTPLSRRVQLHGRALDFVGTQQFHIAPVADRRAVVELLREGHTAHRANVEAHPWRIVVEGMYRATFRRSAKQGGLWRRPEVPAELAAWGATIHERLAAADAARNDH